MIPLAALDSKAISPIIRQVLSQYEKEDLESLLVRKVKAGFHEIKEDETQMPLDSITGGLFSIDLDKLEIDTSKIEDELVKRAVGAFCWSLLLELVIQNLHIAPKE